MTAKPKAPNAESVAERRKRTREAKEAIERAGRQDAAPQQGPPSYILDPKTDEQRAARARWIVRFKALGFSFTRIAGEISLDEKRVRHIHRDYLAQELPPIREMDPQYIVQEMLMSYEQAIEDIARAQTQARTVGERLKAIRARLDAMRDRSRLLQDVGAIPHDLGELRVMFDVQVLIAAIFEVFEEYDVSEAAQLAIVDRVEGRSRVPALVGAGAVTDARTGGRWVPIQEDVGAELARYETLVRRGREREEIQRRHIEAQGLALDELSRALDEVVAMAQSALTRAVVARAGLASSPPEPGEDPGLSAIVEHDWEI
jgi:hypothetical protein